MADHKICPYPPCFILRYLIEIASFICVCILVSLSKNDPFEEHTIGNLSKYFKNVLDQDNTTLIAKESADNIIKNVSSGPDDNIEKIKIRKLISESFCYEIQDNFIRFKGKKLSSIFDLNYNKIHKISIADLVISCVLFVSLIIAGITIKNNNSDNCCAQTIMVISLLIYFLALIGRFILSFILFYYMEKGDLEKYDDFLDCKIVKSKVFKKISDINKYRNCFFAFVVFNVITLGIEKIERIYEYGKEIDEE